MAGTSVVGTWPQSTTAVSLIPSELPLVSGQGPVRPLTLTGELPVGAADVTGTSSGGAPSTTFWFPPMSPSDLPCL